ncbi:MAG: hypothetical protein FWG39_00500 [Alphaproteobacteria bacterium]|nr:hypothetical protein [Alphaproteobacteria bacterium]
MNKSIIFALCSMLFLGACAGSMEKRLDDARADFKAGVFEKQKVGDKNLDPLLSGNALFQQNKFGDADKEFESINRRMEKAQSSGITGEIGRAIAGNLSADYKPYFMDDLFVSYYQIWSAIADGRTADARVIINQSYAKQQRLSAEYASLIRKKEKDSNGLGKQLRAENASWESFKDIMNPALTYLAGIYFLNFASGPSDFETARTYLSRADGMAPGNKFIKQDLAAASARRTPVNTAWIFIESGFSPKLIERRIDWPMVTAGGVSAVSIAVSEPIMLDGGQAVDGAELVANIDAMFMTEYKEYAVNDALRAAASAATKLAMQGTANHYGGTLGGIAAVAAGMAMTSAEIRTWATLPKKIYVLRIDKDAKCKSNDCLITLKSGGTVVTEFKIERHGNHLVYIRLPNEEIKPKIIKLKG